MYQVEFFFHKWYFLHLFFTSIYEIDKNEILHFFQDFSSIPIASC